MTHPARKSISFQLVLAARLQRARLAVLLEDLGLFPGQERTLDLLSQHETSSIGDISRALRVRPPTVSKTINRLASEGLVERIASDTDSRVVLVRLTADGRSKLAELEALMLKAEQEMHDILGEKDAKRLRKLLRRLSRGLADIIDPDGEDFGGDDDDGADDLPGA